MRVVFSCFHRRHEKRGAVVTPLALPYRYYCLVYSLLIVAAIGKHQLYEMRFGSRNQYLMNDISNPYRYDKVEILKEKIWIS